jgi:linoleoyl-CoA desaturase
MASYYWLVLKDAIGWLLILASFVAGPLVPGPGGIPLFLIGFALVNLPGKRRLTARVLRAKPIRFRSRAFGLAVLTASLAIPVVALPLARGRLSWLAEQYARAPTTVVAVHLLGVAVTWLTIQLSLRVTNLLLVLCVPRVRRRVRPWLRRRHIHLLPPRWRRRLPHERTHEAHGGGPLRLKDEILRFYRRPRRDVVAAVVPPVTQERGEIRPEDIMTQITHDPPATEPAQATRPSRGLKFGNINDFQVELRKRVDGFFRTSGRRQRDCLQMYLKTAILLVAFAASYVLLVFFAQTWWLALLLAVLLGLATAAIGFNVQHDGGHQAYSSRPWVNKLAAMTLDLIGGSSYLWHWKHVVFHHTYVNIAGHDTDIELGALGRLSPHQKGYPFHRWQHFYLWPLYGLMAVKWHLYDDLKDAVVGRVGGHRVRRPKGWDLVIYLAGKAAFLALAFGVPMLLLHHRVWVVLLFYGVAALVLGVVLSIVFQLAHCVEGVEFPLPHGTPERIDNAWAVHQVESTVDFARRSRVAAWLLGGLNFQIEHHLFPKVCHVNYPAIAPLVEQTCRDFGVRYAEHETFRAGLASHYRWLRRMGAPTAGGGSGQRPRASPLRAAG